VSDDIARLLAESLAELPTAVDGNHEFEFTARTVPDLPDVLRTDGIVITKSHRVVNGCWRFDSLNIHAPRSTMRGLGLLAMSALFLPPGEAIEVDLAHGASEVKRLRIRAPWSDPFFVMRPVSYTYFPSIPARHPWVGDAPDPDDLPAFLLTDREELGGANEDDWAKRDTVVGFGSAWGTVRLAAFLLDIGNPECTADEFQLEGETGFRGVAPLSAEARFWLPGSFGWENSYGLA